METIFWAFVLRLGQACIDLSLLLIVGAVTAAILRRMVGPAGTRKLFGRGFSGMFRSWIAGSLLPVCSLGVIPVAREIRRAGVPAGTVLAFILAAPLLNPISLLYGLTLAEPFVILAFAGASLFLSTIAGLLWDRLFASATANADEQARAALADAEPLPAQGPKRILAVLVTACKELAIRDVLFFAIGLIGTAMLGAIIPFGALQHTMKHSDSTSPLLMTAVALPIYSTPLPGMMKIGLMFEHANSVGAAFVLFALGIGMSLGTLAYLGTDFGWRRIAPWFLAYVTVIVTLAFLAEPVLYAKGKVEIEHTHAFDDYSSPFTSGTESGLAEQTRLKLAEKFGPLEQPAVYGLLGMLLLGIALRRLDRTGRVERWLVARDVKTGQAKPKWDIVVPGAVLGIVAILGLVVFSVAGAYVYYPDRHQCFEEMNYYYADARLATNGGRSDEAIRNLEQIDLIVRKLEVGVYIRKFRVAEEQSKAAEDYREAVEDVRDAFREGNVKKANSLFGLRAEVRNIRDAALAGDWPTAVRLLDDEDRKRITATPPRKSLSDELGPVAVAIRDRDPEKVKVAMKEAGIPALTAEEAHAACKRAFTAEEQ